MQDQVQLQVPGKLEKLPLIIEFIENSMNKFGMGGYEQFQTQLAIDEAVTNIMLHGGLEEEEKITLKCIKEGNEVTIIIEDKGKPFDPTSMPEPDITAPLEKRKTGGLGIYFIKQYMDQVKYEYKDQKNILTFIKNI